MSKNIAAIDKRQACRNILLFSQNIRPLYPHVYLRELNHYNELILGPRRYPGDNI